MSAEVGKVAPSFVAKLDDGTTVQLSELRKKNVVLYFYPKDDTPGCTIEAQDFAKNIDRFEKLDSIVLGVSKDSIESHCKFINKYNLSFNLISDEDSSICSKYGVLKEKSIFGNKSIGIDRTTFVIDKKGNIAKKWPAVKVNGHVDEVLKFIEDLER